ncbi:CNNM domain-containing protein [bacterium]|nr:CNNM domain-containing protein [bacterium]
MVLFITFLLLSIVFSFWCSVLEAGYLKVTPTFVAISEKEGKPWSARLKELVADPGTTIGAILTLNTIAHTVGAIGVGAQTEAAFGSDLAGHWSVQMGVPVMVTLLILIVSEIIPKNMGASKWKELAGFNTASLNLIITFLKYTGILWLLKQVSKLVGGHDGSHLGITTRNEFSVMAEEGVKQGVFEESESRIIQNLIRFQEIRVQDIMTPRTVINAAQEDQDIREFYENMLKDSHFSRIPTYKTDKDHMSGYVLKSEVLMSIINGNADGPLSQLRRDIQMVGASLPIPELFNKLMEEREHIALVVGEYGGTAGLVTMEDVIETLLGLEIMDEVDAIEDMQHLARKNWEKRAEKLGLKEKD